MNIETTTETATPKPGQAPTVRILSIDACLRAAIAPYAYLTDAQLARLKFGHSMGRVSYEYAQVLIAARAALARGQS